MAYQRAAEAKVSSSAMGLCGNAKPPFAFCLLEGQRQGVDAMRTWMIAAGLGGAMLLAGQA
ncbi:MAG TPA: hypothetical protein VGH15_11900, partial [Caulobacteraceae bacterium]